MKTQSVFSSYIDKSLRPPLQFRLIDDFPFQNCRKQIASSVWELGSADISPKTVPDHLF